MKHRSREPGRVSLKAVESRAETRPSVGSRPSPTSPRRSTTGGLRVGVRSLGRLCENRFLYQGSEDMRDVMRAIVEETKVLSARGVDSTQVMGQPAVDTQTGEYDQSGHTSFSGDR